jgi:hypothetical protein
MAPSTSIFIWSPLQFFIGHNEVMIKPKTVISTTKEEKSLCNGTDFSSDTRRNDSSPISLSLARRKRKIWWIFPKVKGKKNTRTGIKKKEGESDGRFLKMIDDYKPPKQNQS